MFFLDSTPKSGTPVLEIPAFFEGPFLSLNFSEQSLSGEFHRIVKRSANHIEIHSKTATYLDSLSIQSIGLSAIDTAYYNGQKLVVSQDNIERQLNLEDSLKSGLEKISTVVDLSENLFALGDTTTCELTFANGVYYLNVQGDSINYNFIIAVEDKENLISIWTSNSLDERSRKKVEILSKSLKIRKKKIDNNLFYSFEYYADLSDQEFFNLVKDHELFQRQLWYKVNSSKTNWALWAFILIILGAVLVLKKRKTISNNR